MAPPPPDPPSRSLVYDTIDGKPTIVWRGEIPTVHVPRRLDLDPQEDLPTTPTTNISPKGALKNNFLFSGSDLRQIRSIVGSKTAGLAGLIRGFCE